jgi:small nuclear ribonucleoprotein
VNLQIVKYELSIQPGIDMPKPQPSALKPMDVLRGSIEKNVMVDVKGNRGYSGILEGYDVYMNLVIRNAGETIRGETKGVFERILVRGDNVIFVSPSKGDNQ